MPSRELSTRRWRTYRQHLLNTLPPICSLCGKPINMELPGTHPDGPTIDHRQPRSLGGQAFDRNNCTLAHQHCNQTKGNRHTTTTSRNW